MVNNKYEMNSYEESQPVRSISDYELTTPVLFLIFNRPDTTQRVFNEIRKAKPKKLFVSADGPRKSKSGEYENCQSARDIIKQVDWDCEVYTNFMGKNLGCKIAISSGIDWFFNHVEEGVILEDDCLPHATFFSFCQELLNYYRDDKRIMMIGGSNFQFGRKRTLDSYYFSMYTIIWGWASWRRAWKNYDVNMKLWPEIRDGGWLQDLLGSKKSANHWAKMFENVYWGGIDTWDYQWNFACWVHHGLTIIPNVNLISNVGCGKDSTHTSDSADKRANLHVQEMKFPLQHPSFVIHNMAADEHIRRTFIMLSFMERFKKNISGRLQREWDKLQNFRHEMHNRII